jgi:hypothetical protein
MGPPHCRISRGPTYATKATVLISLIVTWQKYSMESWPPKIKD